MERGRRCGSLRRLVPGEAAHGRRRHDLASIGECLVVFLDVIKIVEIVDHQPVGLGERGGREIAVRIDPLELRAVAEVEARDGINPDFVRAWMK